MKTIDLSIEGMHCNHCVGAVSRALKGMDGVDVDRVSIGSATVRFDPDRTSPDQIAGAVSRAGYTVTAAA